MKLRTIFFFVALLVGVTASVAASNASQLYVVASYIDPVNSWGCEEYALTDDDCVSNNTGPQCSCYDIDYGYQPAYLEQGHGTNPCCCVYPLYHYGY